MSNLFYLTFILFSLIVTSFCEDPDDRNVLEKCRNVTGNPQYPHENLQDIVTISMCISLTIRDIAKNYDEIQFTTYEGLIEVFNANCPNYETILLECFDSKMVIVKDCLTEDEFNEAIIYRNILKGLANYLCRDNGNNTAEFFSHSGRKCFQEYPTEITNCIEPLLKKYSFAFLPSSYINNENCDEIKTLKQCLNTTLNRCGTLVTKNVIDLFNTVKNNLSCPLEII